MTLEPTNKIFVSHFGNGDEEDQNVLNEYACKFGEISRVTILPGQSYGHLEFKDNESVQRLMQDMDAPSIKELKFYEKERYVVFIPTSVEFQQLKNRATVDFPQSTNAHTGIIPGLYVYDDFITEGKSKYKQIVHQCSCQSSLDFIIDLYITKHILCIEEENELVKAMDKQEWHKLLNRRVQHYGYEFLYGVNSVDKHSKIGEMPDFLAFLKPSNISLLPYSFILEFE